MDLIFDGDFSTAKAISPLLYSAPIPGVETKYVVTQKFCQQKDSIVPIAIGTEHPDLANFFLVEENIPAMAGGGILTWDRVYSKIPETHSEPSTISYNFIGYAGLFGNGVGTTGRGRWTRSVNCEIQHDYFQIGTVAYPTILDVPRIVAQKYVAGDDARFNVDYLYPAAGPITSSPTLEEYYALIDAETPIAAEDSALERWMGNILVRKTAYILPE
jgi:hypothetical protein